MQDDIPQKPRLKSFSRPPMFGDRDAQNAFLERVDAAQRDIRYPFQVAPGRTIQTTGGSLNEGEQVTFDDLLLPEIRRLVAEGVVLQATVQQLRAMRCPEDARFRVARGKALTTKSGLLGEGAEIRAEDVGGEQQLLRLALKGLVEDRFPPPPEAA